MNDLERRMLDVAQQSAYLASVIRDDRQVLGIDYYSYSGRIGTVAAPLANGATDSVSIQIQADSYFVINYMQANTLNNGGTAVNGVSNFLLQVTDTGSGKTFYNQPTQLTLVTGQQGFPFLLSAPRIVPPSVNLKVDVTNNSGAGSAGITIVFAGARIYYAG